MQSSLPLDVTGGSDIGLEHEVKLDRGSQFVAGSGVSNIVLLDEFTKLGTTKIVNLQISFVHHHSKR
jgi:hypothetical protein